MTVERSLAQVELRILVRIDSCVAFSLNFGGLEFIIGQSLEYFCYIHGKYIQR